MTAQERPDQERRFDQLLSAIADRSRRPHHRDADMILLGAVLENALREALSNRHENSKPPSPGMIRSPERTNA